MSRYEQLQKRNPKDFKRLIGVKKETLEAMIKIFCSYEIERKKSTVNNSPNSYFKPSLRTPFYHVFLNPVIPQIKSSKQIQYKDSSPINWQQLVFSILQ